MSAKIVCYGVRDIEIDFFNKLNKYGYELELVNDYLNDENVVQAKGADAVMIRGNCKADKRNLEILSGYGIKFVLTRTVGYNHIDLDCAKELGLKVAMVPAYSPNAIAELAVTLGMMLLRNTAYAANRTKERDFRVDSAMFSKEIRNCTVGVLGTGKIGLTSAKLFKGLGAKIVAYDVFQSDAAKEVVEFMDLDEMLAVSDIVTVHVPFIKDVNYHLINEEFVSKMKEGAILINTARGELQDIEAILNALENGKLSGYGTDVFEGEASFFSKNLRGRKLENKAVDKLVDMFPKAIVTPHIGSFTDEALTNMIGISYDNMNDLLTSGVCKNQIA
ncbi:lactate dehydrogenase [Clostridium sp. 19966]|uniref:2-hydroxyacid dehydrogenase n=1 Tax=Clostridium sp. 19966 TaxID=2768166 RepID=UPI0028DD61D6|nr:2-hydroxyacid dehydrogenase [Clostridium sp. 19966]MDT8715093.1 lactate dehydrogenase [Clostridium sp. 19966]